MSLFLGLTRPGDTILSLHTSHGGHITHAQFGAAGMRGLQVENFPFDTKEMNIDAEAMKKKIAEVHPKIILFGCSMFLFPHPVREAVEAAKEVDAVIAYDAAHVLGLIAGKGFQDPFREGAKIMTASTHKTFPGPQGGCMMFKNLDQTRAANLQWCIFPVMASNHHLHHVAAKGIAGAEMVAFGKEYVSQTLKNAKALASALHEEGLRVLAEHKGFTESHQVLIDFGEPLGKWAAEALERANIITNKNLMPWDPQEISDNPSGMRLGVQEMTRVGMRESEMKHIAQLFRKTILDKKDPGEIASEVCEMRKGFAKVLYCFDR
jgi:glycine hydroxymethyltransferase